MAAFLFFALSGLFSHCFDGVHRGGAYRREKSGDSSAERCDERERGRQPPSRQQQRGAEPQRGPRERKTGGSAGCAEQHRFAQKDPPDVAFSCAEGKQNADLVRSLVRGGQHAAEHAEQGNEQRNAADSEEEQRAE